MELAYGVWNFEVVPTFLENLCKHGLLDIWLVSYLASLFVEDLRTPSPGSSNRQHTAMNVDDMLALSGDMGCYQYLLMALLSVVNVLSAFHYFAQTFISIEPQHWCVSSGLECMEPDLNDSMRACSSGWQYNLTGGFSTAVSEVDTVTY